MRSVQSSSSLIHPTRIVQYSHSGMSFASPAKRTRKQPPQHLSDDIIEIDPKGDLVVKVGTKNPMLMMLSSKHMTVISKVFQALLGHHFSEGQIQHDDQNPLLLPDDDPKAMSLMCKLAHHKIMQLSDIQANDLESLVVVCDKYDCVTAFKINFHAVLREWSNESKKHCWNHGTDLVYEARPMYEKVHLLSALSIGFLTKDPPSFRIISNLTFQWLQDDNRHPPGSQVPKQLASWMPPRFFGK